MFRIIIEVSTALSDYAYLLAAVFLGATAASFQSAVRHEIYTAVTWSVAQATRLLPWHPRALNERPEIPITSNFTHAHISICDASGQRAVYRKTSNFMASRQVNSYSEAVTAEGSAGEFASMRGYIWRTSREHGFYLSEIALSDALNEHETITNSYTAVLHGSFCSDQESWTQEIAFETRFLAVQIDFPADRPPLAVQTSLVIGTRHYPSHFTAAIAELFGRKGIVVLATCVDFLESLTCCASFQSSTKSHGSTYPRCSRNFANDDAMGNAEDHFENGEAGGSRSLGRQGNSSETIQRLKN